MIYIAVILEAHLPGLSVKCIRSREQNAEDMTMRTQASRSPAATAPPAEQGEPPPEASAPGSLPAERLAYSVDEAAQLTGLSRDLLYDEMRRGHLRYRKVGRRRLITRQHLEEFLGLPESPRSLSSGPH